MDGPGPYKPTCPQILRWQGASDLSAATAVANNPARPRPLTATSSRQSALMLHAFNTSSEQQWFFHPSSAHTAVAGLSQWSSLCGVLSSPGWTSPSCSISCKNGGACNACHSSSKRSTWVAKAADAVGEEARAAAMREGDAPGGRLPAAAHAVAAGESGQALAVCRTDLPPTAGTQSMQQASMRTVLVRSTVPLQAHATAQRCCSPCPCAGAFAAVLAAPAGDAGVAPGVAAAAAAAVHVLVAGSAGSVAAAAAASCRAEEAPGLRTLGACSLAGGAPAGKAGMRSSKEAGSSMRLLQGGGQSWT
eukprot:1157383-Pelagomonas_calceolata.AAC.2